MCKCATGSLYFTQNAALFVGVYHLSRIMLFGYIPFCKKIPSNISTYMVSVMSYCNLPSPIINEDSSTCIETQYCSARWTNLKNKFEITSVLVKESMVFSLSRWLSWCKLAWHREVIVGDIKCRFPLPKTRRCLADEKKHGGDPLMISSIC